jgi:putative flippase GtrA
VTVVTMVVSFLAHREFSFHRRHETSEESR